MTHYATEGRLTRHVADQLDRRRVETACDRYRTSLRLGQDRLEAEILAQGRLGLGLDVAHRRRNLPLVGPLEVLLHQEVEQPALALQHAQQTQRSARRLDRLGWLRWGRIQKRRQLGRKVRVAQRLRE